MIEALLERLPEHCAIHELIQAAQEPDIVRQLLAALWADVDARVAAGALCSSPAFYNSSTLEGLVGAAARVEDYGYLDHVAARLPDCEDRLERSAAVMLRSIAAAARPGNRALLRRVVLGGAAEPGAQAGPGAATAALLGPRLPAMLSKLVASAAEQGNTTAVQELVRSAAPISQRTLYKALMAAVRHADPDAVAALLARGPIQVPDRLQGAVALYAGCDIPRYTCPLLMALRWRASPVSAVPLPLPG